MSAKGVDKYLLTMMTMADVACRALLLSLMARLGDSQESSCRLGIDLRSSFVGIWAENLNKREEEVVVG